MWAIFYILIILLACISWRAYIILPKSTGKSDIERNSKRESCSLAVFLGSGGHTSESLALVSTLDFSRYKPRLYIVSEGDDLSAQKARDLEQAQRKLLGKSSDTSDAFKILVIPRARRVHQSLLTTPPTALRSLLTCCYLVFRTHLIESRAFADVLILNGPGTCFVLCIASYIGKFFGLKIPKLIYVETFARVNSLSLSGKLLRPFVDRFVVQWPNLLADGRRGECHGWLV